MTDKAKPPEKAVTDPARIPHGYPSARHAHQELSSDDEPADRHDATRGLVGGETASTTPKRYRDDVPLFDHIQRIRGRGVDGWERN